MYKLAEEMTNQAAVIRVIGVGGGGCNAIKHMVNSKVDGVELICVNTDVQCLQSVPVEPRIQIGNGTTRGLGAGADPDKGRAAALEDKDRISDALDGCDMVFIAAGMGGGTGTGAAPVIAQVAKERGVLTVAVVTRPFDFEGKNRADKAEWGVRSLSEQVDSLVVISNQKLLDVLGDNCTTNEAYLAVDDVLLNAVRGITELITKPGRINVDFADVRTVMKSMGMSMMGSGTASGEDRARQAVEQAVNCPLLEDINLNNAHGILANIQAGSDLTMRELHDIGETVRSISSNDATIVIGDVLDEDMAGSVRVTIVATGLGEQLALRQVAQPYQGHESEEPSVSVAKMSGVESDVTGDKQPDYAQYMEPTAQRNQSRHENSGDASPNEGEQLDIPAFLRRQAD
ncbi:MAG: cell division protein FtsZ [Candidatus Eutrophobiaceae bacterium]